MKPLILTAVLAVTTAAQGLVTADGVEWDYVGVGQDRYTGEKFGIYARHLKTHSKYPAIEFRNDADNEVFKAEHDCKRKLVRLADGEWRKPAAGSMGEQLVKYACHK